MLKNIKPHKPKPLAIKLCIGICATCFLGNIIYWILFFSAPELIQVRPGDPVYISHHQAFPLADTWLAMTCLFGAIGLWKMKEWGVLFTLLGGSAAIFLGTVDLLYDIQQNIFQEITGPVIGEMLIVGLCISLGGYAIIAVWRHRRLFQQDG